MSFTKSVIAGLFSSVCATAAFGQGATLSFTIDDSDPAYTRNPGYTYEIATVVVVDPSNFRADATNIVTTGTRPPSAVGYALFPVGTTVPTVFQWQDHRDGPLAVAARNESNAATRGSVRLTNRAGGPLTAGTYQLVVAPRDANDRRGDFTLDVTLTGGSFIVLAAPPPGGSGALAGVSRLVVVDAAGVARNQAQGSLATRDQQLAFTRTAGDDGAPLVTVSSMGGDGMMGDVFTWIELTGFYASDDSTDRSIRGYGLQIGADVAIGTNMVLGLSIGTNQIDGDTAGTLTDGDLRFVQPYLAYGSGNWSGEVSLIYGQGDFTQSGVGGDGTGETRLAAVTFDGSYDIALQPGVTISPMVGLVYGCEEITGTGGAVTGTSEVEFHQVSVGGRLTHSFTGGEAFAGLHLDYQGADSDTVLASDILINDGLSARVELGGSWMMDNGVGLDTSIEIGGIGGDFRETSAALTANFRF